MWEGALHGWKGNDSSVGSLGLDKGACLGVWLVEYLGIVALYA